MIDYKLIGLRIKSMRQKNKITQEELSERVDITTVYLSKIENGHVRPTIDLLDSICTAMNYNLNALFLDSSPNSDYYQNELVLQLFRSCSPQVKPIALELLEKLSKLQ